MVKKLEKNDLFFPQIQLRPRHFGFPYVVDVKVKLRDYDDKSLTKFIEYLKKNVRVVELFSISGEWDLTLVLIAKDHEDLAQVSNDIRNKFGSIINLWSESLTTLVYKFEKYDLLELLNPPSKKTKK